MSEYKERKAIEHFEGFLETFVVDKKSYIRSGNSDKVFTEEEIKNVYNSFRDKSKDENKDKKFDEVVKDFPNEYLEILNHAVFLWGLPNNRKPGWIK